jgi:hypothetical protein
LDPLPEESPDAYEAFLCYLEGGKGRRSVKEVAQEMGGSEHTYAEWCTKFQWRARRRAYFASLAQKRLTVECIASQDEALAQAQIRESTERQLQELLKRLIEASSNLFEHKLNHQSDDFKITDILRMIRMVVDQLAKMKRNAPPAAHGDPALRKDLMEVAAYAREQAKLQSGATQAENGGVASAPDPEPNSNTQTSSESKANSDSKT